MSKDILYDEFNCVICEENSVGYGNNPQPIKDEGKCCDKCNFAKVVPARVQAIVGGNEMIYR